MEHMSNGDLKGFLIKNKDTMVDGQRKLNAAVLWQMCIEVSSAIEYLARIKFVHRDIAARNVLVDANECLLRALCSFGS
jgi:serine/threonine protein kinase